MFDKLKRSFQGKPPPVAEKIDNPILGTLTWSEDDKAWVSSATHGGLGFEFQISGTPEPDKTLLAHAADILRKKDDFVARVLQYVKSEAETVRGLRSYQDEIEGLRVDRCLSFMARPT